MKYTKEQLEGMSDFDINRLIAESLGQDWSGITADSYQAYPGLKDYCNSWADMGPLLKPNNISIVNEFKEKPCALVLDDLTDLMDWGGEFQCFHVNELRAAAIVYILIQGG